MKIISYISILLIGLVSCKDTPEPPVLNNKVNPSIQTLKSDTIQVGSDFIVEVPQAEYLAAVTSWGSYFLPVHSKSDNSYYVVVSSEINRQAGRLTLKFFNDTPDQEIFLVAGKPWEPLEAYIGEKSIVANGGEDWAMISVIPQDAYFNLTKPLTQVDVKMVRPNELIQNVSLVTNYGIAHHKIYSGQKVGKTLIAVNTGGVAAKEKELLEIAGPPTDFTIKSEALYPFADSRQYFKIETSEIVDKYNNQVANGTLVQFNVLDADESFRILNAYTISGKAILNINNPSNEGELRVQASIGDFAKSNKASFYFERHIKKMDVDFNDKVITVGPVIGRFGQYASDGTEVVLEEKMTGLMITKHVKSGYVRFSTEGHNPSNYSYKLTCGGFVKTIKSEEHE